MVRLGMCVMTATWTWLIPVMLTCAIRVHHELYGRQSVVAHRLYAERANVFCMLAAWAAEGRDLATELITNG